MKRGKARFKTLRGPEQGWQILRTNSLTQALAKSAHPRGIISVIALGIFALLSIVGIIVQMAVINTVDSVKNSRDFYNAQDVADSAMEYLNFTLNDPPIEPKNFSAQNCVYQRQASGTGGGSALTYVAGSGSTTANDANCQALLTALLTNSSAERVEVSVKMKGYPENGEFLKTGECKVKGVIGFSDLTDGYCFIAPFPGTGTAGEDCDSYDAFNGTQTITDTPTNHIYHPCNWNKLEFGSNLTDRVSIPLYNEYFTPFNASTAPGDKATKFSVRLRTPCIDENLSDLGKATCPSRYALPSGAEENSDDIIVKWQISGQCGEEYCTFGPTITSEISNEIIQGAQYYIALEQTQSTNKEMQGVLQNINSALATLQTPIFTLFLIDKLQTSSGQNIPYLEYQIITDKPIADAKTAMDVTINVDGNVFPKTIYKDFPKNIVDFAIQN